MHLGARVEEHELAQQAAYLCVLRAGVLLVHHLQGGVAVVLVNGVHLRRRLLQVFWVHRLPTLLKHVFMQVPHNFLLIFLLHLLLLRQVLRYHFFNNKLREWIQLGQQLGH